MLDHKRPSLKNGFLPTTACVAGKQLCNFRKVRKIIAGEPLLAPMMVRP
jgi:hypothetical protein